jgi:hypothetical protein
LNEPLFFAKKYGNDCNIQTVPLAIASGFLKPQGSCFRVELDNSVLHQVTMAIQIFFNPSKQYAILFSGNQQITYLQLTTLVKSIKRVKKKNTNY